MTVNETIMGIIKRIYRPKPEKGKEQKKIHGLKFFIFMSSLLLFIE
jgi:hypothetical protein